jgi:hypothetical protein
MDACSVEVKTLLLSWWMYVRLADGVRCFDRDASSRRRINLNPFNPNIVLFHGQNVFTKT